MSEDGPALRAPLDTQIPLPSLGQLISDLGNEKRNNAIVAAILPKGFIPILNTLPDKGGSEEPSAFGDLGEQILLVVEGPQCPAEREQIAFVAIKGGIVDVQKTWLVVEVRADVAR